MQKILWWISSIIIPIFLTFVLPIWLSLKKGWGKGLSYGSIISIGYILISIFIITPIIVNRQACYEGSCFMYIPFGVVCFITLILGWVILAINRARQNAESIF